MFGVLDKWVAEHGHARVPKAERVGEVKLGVWMQSIRNRYRKGTLGEERARRLETLPGWGWNTRRSPCRLDHPSPARCDTARHPLVGQALFANLTGMRIGFSLEIHIEH
jgi:hypothetical protein